MFDSGDGSRHCQTGGEVGLIDPVRPGGDVPDRTEVGAANNAGIRWRGMTSPPYCRM